MFICRDFFDISADKKADIVTFVMFITYVYFPVWFRCTRIENVPVLSLKLFKALKSWSINDKDGAEAACRKLNLHTDYLNGRNVILALASSDVSISTKDKMAHALNSTSDLSDLECGKPVAPCIYQDSNLEDFVNEARSHGVFFDYVSLNHLFFRCLHPIGRKTKTGPK